MIEGRYPTKSSMLDQAPHLPDTPHSQCIFNLGLCASFDDGERGRETSHAAQSRAYKKIKCHRTRHRVTYGERERESVCIGTKPK